MSTVAMTKTFRTIADEINFKAQELGAQLAKIPGYDKSRYENICQGLVDFFYNFNGKNEHKVKYDEVKKDTLIAWKEVIKGYMDNINLFIGKDIKVVDENVYKYLVDGIAEFNRRVDDYIARFDNNDFNLAYEEARDEALITAELNADTYCENILKIHMSGTMEDLERANNVLLEQTEHASIPFLMGEIHKRFDLVKDRVEPDMYGNIPAIFSSFENAENILRVVFAKKNGKASFEDIDAIRVCLLDARKYYQGNIGAFMQEFDYENVARFLDYAILQVNNLFYNNPDAAEYDLMSLSNVRTDAMLTICFDKLGEEINTRAENARIAEEMAKADEEARRKAAEEARIRESEEERRRQEKLADETLTKAGIPSGTLEEIKKAQGKLDEWTNVASLAYIMREIRLNFSETDWDKTPKYNWGIISLVKRETDRFAADLDEVCNNNGQASVRQLKEMKTVLEERWDYFNNHKKLFKDVCNFDRLNKLFEMASNQLDYYCNKFAKDTYCNIYINKKGSNLKNYDKLLGLCADRLAQKRVAAEKAFEEKKAEDARIQNEMAKKIAAAEKKAENVNAEIEEENVRVSSRNMLINKSGELKQTNESHFTKQSRQFGEFRDAVAALTEGIKYVFSNTSDERQKDMKKIAELICDLEDKNDAYKAHCVKHPKIGNKVRDARVKLVQETMFGLRSLKLIPDVETAYKAELERRYEKDKPDTYKERSAEIEYAKYDKKLHKDAAEKNTENEMVRNV